MNKVIDKNYAHDMKIVYGKICEPVTVFIDGEEIHGWDRFDVKYSNGNPVSVKFSVNILLKSFVRESTEEAGEKKSLIDCIEYLTTASNLKNCSIERLREVKKILEGKQ